MEQPLISIIVPVYKVKPYLEKCVKSLLAQDYKEIEIILVDDGSPDECPQLCDELAEKHEKVIALHKQNGGLGSARNYGTEHANGEWIVFVDSDDYVLPHYVSYMWELRCKYNADLVSCGITLEDENGKVLSKPAKQDILVCTKEEAFFSIYLKRISGHRSYSKILKKDYILKNPFPEGYFEDFATTYKYLEDCNTIVLGDGAKNYRYIQRSGSILRSKLNKKHFAAFDICKTLEKYIKQKLPQYEKYTSILYQGQVVQILNRQELSDIEFKKIFNMYKRCFRKSAFTIIFSNKIETKEKIFRILLCTTPSIYKLVYATKKGKKN